MAFGGADERKLECGCPAWHEHSRRSGLCLTHDCRGVCSVSSDYIAIAREAIAAVAAKEARA
jgi:hypothetical protein